MPYFGEWFFQKRPFCCANSFRAATTDTKLEVVSPATNEDQFKWKFIGTKDNFIMVSKAGKYVYAMNAENTTTARFQLGTDAASAETFYFAPCGDYVEIVRVGDTNRYGMNNRNNGVDIGVGIWNNDQAGNRLQFFTVESMFAAEPTLYASAAELNDESLYYYIQFKTGGAVVEDKGAASNAKTAAMANSNAQRWAFIGTSIRLLKAISKAGHYLSYSENRYRTAANEADAVTFELRQSSAHPGYFELVNSGATQAMNQVGGTGAGKDLGVWNIGEVNNPFRVVLPPAPGEPAFYADATPAEGDEWYYIQFCNNSLNWIAPATVGGQVTVTASTLYKEEIMWRFIGDKNSFKLGNKKGEFAYFDGTDQKGFLKTADSDGNTDAYKFSLVVSKGSYAQAWEIKPTVVTSADKPHLMCLYPFNQVNPGTEPFTAAVNSMKLRGDGATGWSMGWKINLWARAKDGDHSRTILNNALRHANGGAQQQTEAPAVYTLDGRRLSPATLRLNKGVYIRGGRKVVVK